MQGQEHPWAPWEAEEEAGMVGGSQAEGSSPGPQEGGICLTDQVGCRQPLRPGPSSLFFLGLGEGGCPGGGALSQPNNNSSPSRWLFLESLTQHPRDSAGPRAGLRKL